MIDLFNTILGKLEVVDSLHVDVKALIAQCKDKQRAYNDEVVKWLLTVDTTTQGIHYGHSRPGKWNLMHLAEFFDNPVYSDALQPNAIQATLERDIGTIRFFSYEQIAKYYNEVTDDEFLVDERFLTTDPSVVGLDVTPKEQLGWELHLRELARLVVALKDYQFIWIGDYLNSTCYAALPHAYDVSVIALPASVEVPVAIKTHPFAGMDFSKLHDIIQKCEPISEDEGW